MKDKRGKMSHLRRCVDKYIPPDQWRGPAESDIDMRITKHRCSYCGCDMEPYQDNGNILVWACKNIYCVNNPDYVFKANFDYDQLTLYASGNSDLRWSPSMVRKVV